MSSARTRTMSTVAACGRALVRSSPRRGSRCQSRALCLLLAVACLLVVLAPGSAPAQPLDEEVSGTPRPKLPDPTYVLERVECVGDFSTSLAIIEDALQLEEGQEVNVEILQEARTRLLATGYFMTAQFGFEPGSERGLVVVRVLLEERNTLLLSDVFLGSSRRSTFWGGVDVLDGNLFGIGHTGRVAFVASGDQLSVELGYEDPALFGGPVSVGLTPHFSMGLEEAYPTVARFDVEAEPLQVDVTRAGARLSAGLSPLRHFGFFLDLRYEAVDAQTPRPDLTGSMIVDGLHGLATASLTAEYDTRDDPVMAREGVRVNLAAIGSGPLSDYTYIKTIGQLSLAHEFAPGHIVRGDLVGGAIFGAAPYFERFFVGDFNDLLPARNLGLNFATRPAADFFRTGTDHLSYENFVFRASVEYAIPIIETFDWIYRTEFFLGGGIYGATTFAEDRDDVVFGLAPTPGGRSPIPFDLTVNLGLRVETSIGIFGLSFANGLALVPF